MIATLLLIALLGGIALLALRHYSRKDESAGKEKSTPTSAPATRKSGGSSPSCPTDSAGCGVSCFCDEATLKRAVTTEAEYFDDEELDRYKGIGSDDYTEQQTEEFNEVLTTLKPTEVGDWLRSLQLRGIELPSSLKDEALMLMNDAHSPLS